MTMIGVVSAIRVKIRGPLLVHATEPGPWGVDAVAMRASDGRLIIPGDQVQGKIREAMEQCGVELAPSRRSEELRNAVQRNELEGDYVQSLEFNLNAPASRYPIQFSDLLSVNTHPQPGIQTLTHVKMNPETGATETGMLRILDCPLAPGEVEEFLGEIRFFARSESEAIQRLSIIQRALSWVLSLGSQKTVGFGRIVESPPPEFVTVQEFVPQAHSIPAACNQYVVDFSFLDPVCVPEGLANGNLFETRQDIPGETLRGAIVGLLHRVHGTSELLSDFPQHLCESGPYKDLCRWFSRIRVSTARPVVVTTENNGGDYRSYTLPQVIPKSTGLIENVIRDFALLSDREEALICAEAAPAFFPDWKSSDWNRVAQTYGIVLVPTELRVRTAIDSIQRRAQTGNLFAYESLNPNGKLWRSIVSINDRPDAKGPGPSREESDAALVQLFSLLNTGWLSVSKTKARGRGQVVMAGRFPDLVIPDRIDDQDVYFIVLRGPALMIDPRRCVNSGRMASVRVIDKLYSDYWTEISGGALEELAEKRFKQDSLVGGFQARQYRYAPNDCVDLCTDPDLEKRKELQKTFPYNPTLLVNPGSVFGLKVVPEKEAEASRLISTWLAYGLPLPDWAKKAYGDTHHTNIFLPQNGFGEIQVRSGAFEMQGEWNPIPISPTQQINLVADTETNGAAQQNTTE